MRDVEYVLRFFWEFTINKEMQLFDDKSSVNVKKEMNLFMDLKSDKYEHNQDYIKKVADLFEKTMNYLNDISDDPFRLQEKKTLDPILFDSFAIAVAVYIDKYKELPTLNNVDFCSAKNQFIQSDEYLSITNNTRRPTYNSILSRSKIASTFLFGYKR